MRRTLLLAGLLFAGTLRAQISADHHYFYEPRPLTPGASVVNLGLSMTLLPQPIVEQEIPAPAVNFQFKHGLSKDFSFYGDFSTNVFTNVLYAGSQFNQGDEDFSWAVGASLVGFAGFLSVDGQFDNNSAAAVAVIPVIRLGRKFETFAISLSVSGSYVLHADTKVATVGDNGLEDKFNDIFFTLAFEQPFFKETHVSAGVSVGYSRTPYQSWMLFNTFDQYLMLPEFFFAFEL